MSQLLAELITLRGAIDRIRQRYAWEQEQIERLHARLRELEAEKTLLVRVVGLIDRTIMVVSANGIGRIESTVTNGLNLVFAGQEPMAFRVMKKEGALGNSYELEIQQGAVHGPILDTFGGGVANVTSFLLRVMMLKRFKLAKFLVLDESFNNVSGQYLPMVSELLRSLAHEGDFTIFAVSHQAVLAAAADHVYRAIENPDGPPLLQRLTSAQMAEIRREAGV